MPDHSANRLPDEAALVAAAQNELPYGQQAFSRLVELHYPLVRRVAFGMLGSADEADGAAQDVMLRVFHALPRFRGEAKFSTWLITITHNLCRTRLSQRKAEQRRQQLLATEPAFSEEASTDISEAGDSSISDSTAAGFSAMVAGLTEDERGLLALRFVADLELKDIAGITGQGLSATKMRFYRALEKLRQSGNSPG